MDKTLRNKDTWQYNVSGSAHTARAESSEVEGSPLRFCLLSFLFPFLFAFSILFPFPLYFLSLLFLSFLSVLSVHTLSSTRFFLRLVNGGG